MTNYDKSIIVEMLKKEKFNYSDYYGFDHFWKEYGMYIIGVDIDKDERGKYYITMDISYDENDTTVHIEPTIFGDISASSLKSIIHTYYFLIDEIYNAMK